MGLGWKNLQKSSEDWRETYRTHSCVPCRDSSRHVQVSKLSWAHASRKSRRGTQECVRYVRSWESELLAACQAHRRNNAAGSGPGSPDRITGAQYRKLAVSGFRRSCSLANRNASALLRPALSSLYQRVMSASCAESATRQSGATKVLTPAIAAARRMPYTPSPTDGTPSAMRHCERTNISVPLRSNPWSSSAVRSPSSGEPWPRP